MLRYCISLSVLVFIKVSSAAGKLEYLPTYEKQLIAMNLCIRKTRIQLPHLKSSEKMNIIQNVHIYVRIHA